MAGRAPPGRPLVLLPSPLVHIGEVAVGVAVEKSAGAPDDEAVHRQARRLRPDPLAGDLDQASYAQQGDDAPGALRLEVAGGQFAPATPPRKLVERKTAWCERATL